MKQTPILMYHWFRPAGARSTSRSPQLEITPELFERQIDLLSRAGYTSVGLKHVAGSGRDRPLPAKPIVITFDDGTFDFWQHARPVLDRHGFTATLFVVTGYVGKESSWDRDLGEPARRLLTWDQIAELHHAGYEIGSHTRFHRPLTQLTDEQARLDVEQSREDLRRRLGAHPEFLAYPRGFYASRHKRIAQQAGYLGACAVILGWRDIMRSGPYELKRMTIKGTESMLRFRLRLGLSKLIPYADPGRATRT